MSDTQHERDDWNRPRPERTCRPTYAPAALALGITMVGWGLLVSPLMSLVGGGLMVMSITTWIRRWMEDV